MKDPLSHARWLTQYNLGVEFGARVIEVDGKPIKLQVWDTVASTMPPSLTWYRLAKRRSDPSLDRTIEALLAPFWPLI